MRKAHGIANNLSFNLDNLETTKTREPTKDHSTSLERVANSVTQLTNILSDSSVSQDHILWETARDFQARLSALETKETPPTTASTTTTIIDTSKPGVRARTLSSSNRCCRPAGYSRSSSLTINFHSLFPLNISHCLYPSLQ